MERDQGIRRLEDVGGTPRPRVGREIGHDPRADRIPVEGPERGKGGGVRLDETRPIAPPPEVAPPSAGFLEDVGGFRQNPSERSAEGLVRGGPQKTVHESGHQRGGVHRDLVRPDQLTQMGDRGHGAPRCDHPRRTSTGRTRSSSNGYGFTAFPPFGLPAKT